METNWMLGLVLMTAIVTYSSASTVNGVAGSSAVVPGNTCHVLMTDMECAAYQLALSTVPSGAAHEQLLAEYRGIILERETTCSCNRTNTNEVIYPDVQQIALRF